MRTLLRSAVVLGLVLGASALVRAEDQAEVKAIIDKALQALGGADTVSKFKAATWKGKGKFYGLGDGIDFNGQWTTQPPHQSKVVSEVDINGMKFMQIRVVNGDRGWIKMMDNTEEMDKEALREAQEELYAGWVASVLPLRDPAFKLSLLGDAKVGDRPAVGVKVMHKNHRDINLYFDKERGLLLRAETRVKDMMTGQEVAQETLPSDYKEVEGVQRARKITLKRDGKNFVELDIDEIQLREQLDDSAFGKP